MGRRRVILAGIIVVVAVLGYCLIHERESGPVLIFNGYGAATAEGRQTARFELRNTSNRTIWLVFEGREWPLNIPFLKRPVIVPVSHEKNPWTNDIIGSSFGRFGFGHYFNQIEKLLPGQKRFLEFQVERSQPATLVGVAYYVGRFNEGDFPENLWTPVLDRNASLRERIAFYWGKAKRVWKAPRRCEVWCSEAVCFEGKVSGVP